MTEFYIVTPEFSLSGAGKCRAETDVELVEAIKHALALSPTDKVIVERHSC